jgi:hypothetical protein
MVLIEELSPHMKLAKVKPAHDTANSVRVPSARDPGLHWRRHARS